MDGASHYREAERLLKRSQLDDIDYDTSETDRPIIDVHLPELADSREG